MTHQTTSEMAANVWKVLVRQGDSVKAGEEIVILESMKMEIPLVAGADGVVADLAVAEGDAVVEGQLLFTIGPA